LKRVKGEEKMKVRVLVIEGHNLLRQGLCSMISEMPNFEVIGQASNGKDGVYQAGTLHPDLILIDLCMPGMTGFEAIFQIKKRLPEVKTVILTDQDNDDYVHEALRIGANGYVLKNVSFDEFSLALKLIVRGSKYFCNQTSMHMLDAYIQNGDAPKAKTAWAKLSERERSIMKLVAEGYTNRAAGQFLYISCKTVEKHRASLMHKLGLRNAADLVTMAIELGLVERPRRPVQPQFAAVAPTPYPEYILPSMILAGVEPPVDHAESRAV
jgi:DNA-binding NarL/FixJ family response regulator